MKNLITFITEAFQMYRENVAIKEKTKSIKYKDLLIAINYIAASIAILCQRNSNNKNKVGLVADNSIEWIVIFIGILFSGHVPVLISTKLSRNKILHILNDSNVTIVFTDQEYISSNGMYKCFSMDVPFDTISKSFTEVTFELHYSYNGLNNIDLMVYTPRNLKQVTFSNSEILSLLSVLGSKNIFKSDTEVEINQDFSINYVFCLLLPLLSGTTIVLDSYKWNNEVIILKVSELQQILKSYLREITVTKFIWCTKFLFIGKWWLRKKFKKLFPELKTLIILNSSLPNWIENMFKWIGIPYTVTYGTTETMGIATYTEPDKFKKGSVGMVLPYKNIITFSNKLFLASNEFAPLNDTGYKVVETLYFTGREDEVLYTKDDILDVFLLEKLYKSIPLIDDCFFIVVKGKVFLVVNLNNEYCETQGILHLRKAKETLRNYIQEITKYKNIYDTEDVVHDIIIEPKKFSRDINGHVIKTCLQ